MSEPPIQPPPIPAVPLPYYTPGPGERKKPVFLSIITWASIIYGGFSAFGILAGFSAIFMFMAPTPAQGGAPGDMMKYMGFQMVIYAVGGVAGIFLLIGGIKSLRLQPVGRKLIMGYCLFYLVYAFAPAAGESLLINSMAAQGGATGGPPPNPATIRMVAMIAGGMIVLFYWAINGTILFYLRRSVIRDLFEPRFDPQSPEGFLPR